MGDNETTTMITNTTSESELIKANITEWRPRIEHAQIMTMKDLRRTSELGSKYQYACLRTANLVAVIASVQPTHAYVWLPGGYLL